MEWRKYRFTLKHSKCRIKLSTVSTSMEEAKQIIMDAEHCPESAIIKSEDLGVVCSY